MKTSRGVDVDFTDGSILHGTATENRGEKLFGTLDQRALVMLW